MSAIREVKFLKELHHENVIEAGFLHPDVLLEHVNDLHYPLFSSWMSFHPRQI
jgi:hypothetical protein